MRIEHTGSRKTCSGTSETACGSRSSDSIRRGGSGWASVTKSERDSRSSWTAARCFGIPRTPIRSKAPSRGRSRLVLRQRNASRPPGWGLILHQVSSEQQRQGREPEDFEHQGDDRRQRGDGRREGRGVVSEDEGKSGNQREA